MLRPPRRGVPLRLRHEMLQRPQQHHLERDREARAEIDLVIATVKPALVLDRAGGVAARGPKMETARRRKMGTARRSGAGVVNAAMIDAAVGVAIAGMIDAAMTETDEDALEDGADLVGVDRVGIGGREAVALRADGGARVGLEWIHFAEHVILLLRGWATRLSNLHHQEPSLEIKKVSSMRYRRLEAWLLQPKAKAKIRVKIKAKIKAKMAKTAKAKMAKTVKAKAKARRKIGFARVVVRTSSDQRVHASNAVLLEILLKRKRMGKARAKRKVRLKEFLQHLIDFQRNSGSNLGHRQDYVSLVKILQQIGGMHLATTIGAPMQLSANRHLHRSSAKHFLMQSKTALTGNSRWDHMDLYRARRLGW